MLVTFDCIPTGMKNEQTNYNMSYCATGMLTNTPNVQNTFSDSLAFM